MLDAEVAQEIVDGKQHRSDRIAASIGQDEPTIGFVLRNLEAKGLLTLSKEVSEIETVAIETAMLKRLARGATL